MTIRIIVNGAKGKMGSVTVAAIKSHPQFSLVAELTKQDDLYENIKKSSADVVIDFTHPNAGFQNTLTILEAGARPLIGTTGITRDQIASLQKRSRELKRGGLIAPNFSLGAVLMMKYAAEIAKYFPQVEIIEMHHEKKVDRPSGTALLTAEKLAEAQKEIQADRIPIHSVRMPGFLAHQQVIFGTTGETLTLKHDTIDRSCFMPGLLLAAEKVMHLNELLWGLDQVV